MEIGTQHIGCLSRCAGILHAGASGHQELRRELADNLKTLYKEVCACLIGHVPSHGRLCMHLGILATESVLPQCVML